MADINQRQSHNAAGRFYVDHNCIDCDLCRETAPDHFTRHEQTGLSYVFRQPEDEAQAAQCLEALAGCPVEAIGADGNRA